MRGGIPLIRHLGAYRRYSGAFIITSDALKKLRESGWVINGGKSARPIPTVPPAAVPARSAASRGEVEKIVTPCVYASWYGCLRLTACGCVNGTCSWKPNPEFEKCLRGHGVGPSKVIRAGPVEVTARGPNPKELTEIVKEFIRALGINCTRIEINSGPVEGPPYNTSSVNASKVVERVLGELSEGGFIKGLAKQDVEAIAKVFKWGGPDGILT